MDDSAGRSQSNESTSLLNNVTVAKRVSPNLKRTTFDFENPRDEINTDNIKRIFPFLLSILSSILFIIVVFYYFKLRNDHQQSLLVAPPKLPRLSIHTTKKDGEDFVYVVDNYPLPESPSLMEATNGLNQLKANSDNNILAEGRYVRNVHENGWHYLSIKAADLGTYKSKRKMESSRNSKNDDELDSHIQYFSQKYLRTMEALGYLGLL